MVKVSEIQTNYKLQNILPVNRDRILRGRKLANWGDRRMHACPYKSSLK